MQSSRFTRSAAARLALDITNVLPAELLGWIAGFLLSEDLCRLARAHSTWRAAVDFSAERRVRAYLRTTLRLEFSPCWLHSLSQIERLTAAVGPRPDHGWRQEWQAMKVAAGRLHFAARGLEWEEEDEAAFDDGGPMCMAREIERSNAQGLLGPELHGCWDEEAALYISCIGGGEESRILHAAFKQRSAAYAALMHASLSAYSSAACVVASQGLVPPPLYATLAGEDGLLHYDEAWRGLEDLAVGAEFRSGGCCAALAGANTFPDEQGMFYGNITLTNPGIDDAFELDWQLVDSDIVRFVSRPADRCGYHALVQDLAGDEDEDPSWGVPHDSVVRLEAISEAGEWTVRGLRVRRRLYTVSISFG